MYNAVPFLLTCLFGLLIRPPQATSAFAPASTVSTSNGATSSTLTLTRKRRAASASLPNGLHLASESDGGGGLFGGLFGGGQKNDPASVDPNWDDPNRGIVLFEIPLDVLKVGGLRIALCLHCIGQQNTPTKSTWLARKCDDGVIEMWFNNPDQSGMFTVTLTELAGGKGNIAVERHGPQPSLAYQLQESLQLHKVLDELDALAFGTEEGVEDKDRLLVLKEDDGIEVAREKLPERPAE